MENYEELKQSLENYKNLLDEALGDLAQDNDCKHCANVAQCSARRIARNFTYGGCFEWQWRSADKMEKAS